MSNRRVYKIFSSLLIATMLIIFNVSFDGLFSGHFWQLGQKADAATFPSKYVSYNIPRTSETKLIEGTPYYYYQDADGYSGYIPKESCYYVDKDSDSSDWFYQTISGSCNKAVFPDESSVYNYLNKPYDSRINCADGITRVFKLQNTNISVWDNGLPYPALGWDYTHDVSGYGYAVYYSITYAGLVYQTSLEINSPSQNDTISEVNNCVPTITVADPDGDVLTCKFFIDSKEKETKTISNTATPQRVAFNTLDISNLSDGSHTLKFEVSGKYGSVSKSVVINVDKLPPTLGAVSFSAEDTSITISGTATDSSDTSSLKYRYTVGNIVSDWVSDTVKKISSLSPDTKYNVKFEVIDKVGHIISKEQEIRTKAQIPQISVSNINERSMVLSINDINSSSTQYQIMAGSSYVTADGTLTSSPIWITPRNKKITISELSPNSQYTFKAKAKNSEDVETSYSIPKNATTLAQAPANIIVKHGANFMEITWNAISGVEGYDLEADGKILNVGTALSYIHDGLQVETSHTYRVRARNAGGAGTWSDYISGMTLPNPPESPVITATNTTQSAITINWDAVANATGYDIEADGKIISTGLDTTYTDEGLTPDSQHKYRIRAKNAGGDSDWSAFTQISTLPNPPEVPKSFVGTPTMNDITLTWEAADRAEGYEIELDGNISTIDTKTLFVHKGLLTNSTHTYRIRACNKGGKSGWSSFQTITTWPELPGAPTNIMATAEKASITVTWYSSLTAESYDVQVDGDEIVNVKETSYTDTDLIPGEKHTYKVRAKNISGYGEWSNPIEISTLPQEVNTTTESAISVNVVAIVTNNSVTLSWQAVAATAQYEIEIDGVVSDIGKETMYNDTGLEPVSFHTYKIGTKNENGNIQWCAVLVLYTLPNPPDALSDVYAIAGNTYIELKWTKVEGTDYEVEVDGEVIDVGEVSGYIDNGLKPGTTHTYRVRGKNISGVTAWSDLIQKSTLSPSNEVECLVGGEFKFSLVASNMQDFGNKTFVVIYNPKELEVEDLCENTADKDLMASGLIPGTNISVKYIDGRIEFTVNESITPGTTWSGEVITVIFKSKIDGKAVINFSIE